MDKTYGNLYGGAPANANSASSAFKTNVKRSKTRKWVEAKVQSYDGDDWGADYDDNEDEDEDESRERDDGREEEAEKREKGEKGEKGEQESKQLSKESAIENLMGPRHPHPLSSSTFPSPRSSSGPAPLHIQTNTTDPHRPTPPPQTDPQQRVVSLQSARGSVLPNSATVASSVHSSDQANWRSASPVSRTASPAAAMRFPPRKSSMGQHDAAAEGEQSRSASSSPAPGRPRAGTGTSSGIGIGGEQQRATSPASAKAAKPLPFIRPADIYKRFAEERDRENQRRVSLESGRGSMDSRGSERPDLTPTAAKASVERIETPLGLPPVAEGQSDYGLEGLLDSYGREEVAPESVKPVVVPIAPSPVSRQEAPREIPPLVPTTTTGTRTTTAAASAAASAAPSPQDVQGRPSRSPQLPNLARMSTFGDDFFSQSSAPPRAPLKDTAPTPTTPRWTRAEKPLPELTEMPEVQSHGKEAIRTPLTALPPITTSALPASTTEPTKEVAEPSTSRPSTPGSPTKTGKVHSLAHAINSRSSSPTKEIMSSQDSPTRQKHREYARPALPGGWVSETPTTPGDVPAPTRLLGDEAKSSAPKNLTPTTRDARDSNLASAGVSHASGPLIVQDKEERTVQTNAAPEIVAHTPLRRSSSLEKEETQDQSSTKQSPKTDAVTSSEAVTSINSKREITPTAPLNPRKSFPSSESASQQVARQPLPARQSTSDTSTSSPVKQSDILREEIMKTLSPIQSYEEFTRPRPDSFLLPAHETGRESSYLPDLYDDYWASSEDKGEQAPAVPEKPPSPVVKADDFPAPPGTAGATMKTDGSAAAKMPGDGLPPPLPPPKNEPKESSTTRPGMASKRFSWETGTEDAKATPTPARLTIELETPGESRLTAPSDGSVRPGKEGKASPADHRASGKLSYQVSEASTSKLGSNLPDPPSPVSMLSEYLAVSKAERVTSSSSSSSPSPESSSKMATTAAESVPLPTSPTDVASTPTTRPFPPDSGTASPTGPGLTPTAPQHPILTFRDIMALSTPSERIRAYRDARAHVAALDTGLTHWMASMRGGRPGGGGSELGALNGSYAAALAVHDPDCVPRGLAGGSSHLPLLTHGVQGLGLGMGGGGDGDEVRMGSGGGTGLGFAHSGGHQAATKSKEFLKSAGKAGKGLLSKGREKLRETRARV